MHAPRHLQDQLTPYQTGIWIEAMLEPAPSQQYTVALCSELPDHHAAAHWENAIKLTLAQETAWRTRLSEEQGIPLSFQVDDLPQVEIAILPDTQMVEDHIARWHQKAWNLIGHPLLEAQLLQCGHSSFLLLRAHHIVVDSWGLGILLGKIVAAAQGNPMAESDIPQLSSHKEHNELAPADGQKQLADALRGLEPILFSRRENACAAEYRFHVVLPKQQVRQLIEQGISPLHNAAASLAILLSSLHHQPHAVIGLPLLNREPAQLLDVSQRANLLPLSTLIDPRRSLRELACLLKTHIKQLKGLEHILLSDAAALLENGAGSRQWFDATLSYMRHPELSLKGACATRHFAHVHDRNAVAIHMHTHGDYNDVDIDICVNQHAFGDHFSAADFANMLSLLMSNFHLWLDHSIRDLPLADKEDLRLEHGPSIPYHSDKTIISLFVEQAQAHPTRVAAQDASGCSLSYQELDTWSSNIAHLLQTRGAGPGKVIAVALPRSIELLATIFGILKSGAAYLPIDSEYPIERIQYMLENSQALLLVAERNLLAPENPHAWLNTQDIAPSALCRGPAIDHSSPNQLAYLIYTSGSTGRPKGVAIEHHSVVNRLEWMQQRYPLRPEDVILQKTPISFDVSVWELFWWSIAGASVALLEPGAQRDPRELIRAIAKHRVSILHFVPSMFEPYIQMLKQDKALLDATASIRRIFTSGEALNPASVNQFKALYLNRNTDIGLTNLYGPTEATVDVSYYDIDCSSPETLNEVPIGYPIQNTKLRIVSPSGSPLPPGMPGELLIGGVQLARCYWNRPELTAEKFPQDTEAPETRWYRTGDLAMRERDGAIHYLGRIDGQVKIRGNRIELGEIKSSLASLPGIDTAEVLVEDHPIRGKQLIAVYIARNRQDAESLRRQLLKRLPPFMIPAHFHAVECIPLTPNGKFDRGEMIRMLAKPDHSKEITHFDKHEQLIANIWEQVLGRAPQHPDDDFYALGGDSLLMLKVRSELEDSGLQTNLLELTRHTRLGELANLLVHRDGAHISRQEPLLPFALLKENDATDLRGYQDAYPASQLQLGLIYHSRETADSRKYKDVFRYSLKLKWNPNRFRTALKETINRNPALRTRFNLTDFEQALQLILPEQDLSEILIIRQASDAVHEKDVSETICKLASHPYNFQHGPLYGFTVFTLPDGIDLIFHFHHALLDGGSVANLMRELLMRYAAQGPLTANLLPHDLPNPSIYMRNELDAIDNEETRIYWSNYLNGAPSSSAPSGLAKRLGENRGGLISHQIRLAQELHVRVHSLAAASRLPAKSLFLAAHCLTLAALSGNDEIVTGIVTHIRPEVRYAEHLLGLFLNTLPLRFCRQGLNWLDAAREVFQTEKRHHPHRHLPQSEIQAAAEHSVSVNTAFNYIHFHMLQDALDESEIELSRFDPQEETNFDILVNVMRDFDGNGTIIRVDMNGDVFAETQAERYAQIMRQVLENIINMPNAPASLGRPLAECGLSRRISASASFSPVTKAIQEIVLQKPDAIAITHGATAWSYRQLWEHSNQIASLLKTNDCGQGQVVGIALERSPELVATLLAVLRVGAVCLPLDLAYPAGRIEAILEQADPQAIIAVDSFQAGRFQSRILRQCERTLGAQSATPDTIGFTDPSPDDLAYILFTSGSTGQPKGVAMPHRGLANLIAWQNSTQSGASYHSTLQFAPLSFDVSFQEIFSTLAAGGMLHLIGESLRKDPVAVLKLLDQHWIERIYLPYIALQQLAETAVQLNLIPEHLKVVISSGEQLRVTDEIRKFIGALKGGILENQYGPTETHVVAFHTLDGRALDFPALPPIGKSVVNSGLLLLDRDMQQVPDGAPGEICVYGDALAAGYYHAPELTAQRFVSHDCVPGTRLYRTGDIGIRLPDGGVISLGRNDSQVKVRGYRIELAEIEVAALSFFESIAQSVEVAVIARTRESHDAYLIAYLRGARDDVLSRRLRDHLAGKLPSYMLPSHFEWIDDIPRTPSGKRDDARLRQMELTPHNGGGQRPPQDSLEFKLCQMAAKLLELPAVAPEQNLFESGATSLTAMRLVVLVDKHYGVDIPLSSFISAPTIAQLASLVRAGNGGSQFDSLVPMRTTGSLRPLFMVHPMGGNVLAYMRMLKHLSPEQPLYALQASGVDAGSVVLPSVETQASHYIETIRRIQPHGPYTLGGWSYGGFIAFEMSRQLQAAGETVSDLFVLDTVALSSYAKGRANDDALLGWFFWELLWLANGSALPAQIVPDSITELQQRFEYIADHAIRSGALPEGSSRAVIQRLFDVYRTNWRAATEYDAGQPNIDITLLRARQPLPQVLREMHDAIRSEYQDPQNGWGNKTTGRITTIDIDGDHLTIMEEPFIGSLVTTMLKQMDAANKEIEHVG
ncbi:non-ribosomal peptide synthetase [Chromobacterium phragmitis]|uniref:Non-ribosomal peptide synthetase n=2 Tax=Chromobacterium phragmitis TaxID=2202141 RepID=A0A344UDE6_9NEIS|nr:non-ribosomal peptide synthetase [Chromobacterium phragmitis]